MAEEPVSRGLIKPIACVLVDHQHATGSEHVADIVQSACQVVRVMQGAAGHNGVEAIRVRELLKRGAAEDLPLRRIEIIAIT